MWCPRWIEKNRRRRWKNKKEKLRFPPANPWNAHGANDRRDFICRGSQLHFWAALNQVCPCLRWCLPIGKRSGWNIGIAPAGREDACFSMFALVTPAPINAALTNLPRSGNHIFESLKGVFPTRPSQWPASASYLPPFTPQSAHNPLCIHTLTRGCCISSCGSASVTVGANRMCTVYFLGVSHVVVSRVLCHVGMVEILPSTANTFKC